MKNNWAITYSDFIIGSLDEDYLNRLSEEWWIAWEDMDISDYLRSYAMDINSAWVTNAIIYELLYKIADMNVEDEDDLELIKDSIYCNCFDSHYNISEDELKTEQAKEFIRNF